MSQQNTLIVQKYGGSSVATSEHIKRVAENILAKKDRGHDLIVVVSAMGKTTDQFIKMAQEVSAIPDRRELDMLISVGERISISLLAMAINSFGKYRAVSFTGSQVGIITDDNHTDAQILEVKGHRIAEALAKGYIVVVAGFQGVSVNKEITTLGRGGSDTTAVALAAALNAEACEIMSDVDGIYTADPHIIPVARRIDRIDYDQALEMAGAGAKMLQRSAVELAKRHQVTLSLGSTFSGYIGTIVTNESMRRGTVTAVVTDYDMVLVRCQFSAGSISEIPELLSQNHIRPKLWQCVEKDAWIGLTRSDMTSISGQLEPLCSKWERSLDLGILTLVGNGIGIGTEPARRFFLTLRDKGIEWVAVASNETSLRVAVPRNLLGTACSHIHQLFFEAE